MQCQIADTLWGRLRPNFENSSFLLTLVQISLPINHFPLKHATNLFFPVIGFGLEQKKVNPRLESQMTIF